MQQLPFHDGMSATVAVGGGTSNPFSVRNSLRQRCTIAPTLFILYFELIIDRWLSQCQVAGVEVQFKMGGKLIGERARKPMQALLYCQSSCLQMMLLWCAPVERIWCWLPEYLMK